jgi:hypothetical protein
LHSKDSHEAHNAVSIKNATTQITKKRSEKISLLFLRHGLCALPHASERAQLF